MARSAVESTQIGNPDSPRVVPNVEIDLRKRGFQEARVPSISVTEVTSLIREENGRKVVVQSLTWEAPVKPEYENKPKRSIVVIGGGSSDAYGNAALIGRVNQAIEDQGGFEFNYNIIILPHVFGSARENPFVAKPQTEEDKKHNRIVKKIRNLSFIGKTGKNYYKETFAEDAKILEKALEVSEVGCQENVILIGYSAGGKQAIELAARLGDRVELLMLADSAGMAEHKDMLYEFSAGTTMALWKKYYGEKKENPIQAIRHVIWEMGSAWVTPKGPASNLIKIARDFTPFSPQGKLIRGLAEEFGLDKAKLAKIGADSNEIQLEVLSDSRDKITAPVVASPIMFARVVNFIYEEVRNEIERQIGIRIGKGQDVKELFRKFGLETLEQLEEIGLDSLKNYFPKSKSVSVVLHEDSTHPVPMLMTTKEKYWNNLLQKASEVLEAKDLV
jgi:pimeloyl-ACP methyl ester carboxylesterase